MGILSILVLFAVLLLALSYHNVKLVIWDVAIAAFLVLVSVLSHASVLGLIALWLVTLAILVPINIPSVREKYLITPFFALTKKMLPPLSETEEQAIDAGTVNWDGEVFSGRPNWKSMYQLSQAAMSEEEQTFIDNETRELCRLATPWDYILRNEDSPPELVDYIRKNGFMTFLIPKKYGGKEFSAFSQSQICLMFSSRSMIGSYYISVPNSLGPGELIEKYGTQEQIEYYLPRLSSGEEIPCFALTGPFAGSDAGSLPDNGIICKGKYHGKEVLGIKLTFKKRYITLAPVATLVALAFKLYDPDHLLSDKEEYGITCALVPANTKSLKIGRRHMPLRQAFPNGPIEGKDVFIPLDNIIGGIEMAGRGWQMLIECLSVGRVITLPTIATSGCKTSAYAAGYYARIRKQFGISIGEFDGVQEALADIAGLTFITDAIRHFTLAAVARGEKPSVPSAISKYHTTEFLRKVGDRAMDVHGGK
ncbi:MAG: acyl-CoA dehydrogenase, partial [Coxiellaceae bacterium]|nr:acyl-CoA dehydrogenase [Coxiellaceae bacterium]